MKFFFPERFFFFFRKLKREREKKLFYLFCSVKNATFISRYHVFNINKCILEK
jgi:hypothetical protein